MACWSFSGLLSGSPPQTENDMAHDFGKTGGAIEPHQPKLSNEVQNRLPHRSTPMFRFRSHPMRWHLVGDEWLPQLGTIKTDLGVNGCDKTGNMDITYMESGKRGWTPIPLNVIEGGYVRAWPAQGGDYHCTKWQTPRHVGERILDEQIDTEGYHKFLRAMIKAGHIPPPNPDILEQIHLDQQQKEVERLAKESHKPGVLPAYNASKDKLERMIKAIDALRKKAA
jgi:hypothetical protein